MNLSSSEDEDDGHENDELSRFNEVYQSQQKTYNYADKKDEQEEESDDESGFSDVEWEDACAIEEGEEEEEEVKMESESIRIHQMRKFPKEDVTVHFDNFNENAEQSNLETKHRKRKRINKIKHVSTQVENILLNLQRSHILSLVARSVYLSSIIGNMNEEVLWGIAYSLIPVEFHNHSDCTIVDKNTAIPNIELVQKFCAWFFEFINVKVSSKRSKTKTKMDAYGEGKMPSSESVPTATCSVTRLKMILQYLSSTENNPDLIPIRAIDKVLIFICMTRSLKWRVRFVTQMNPMDKELTPDHPLFSTSIKHTFQAILKSVDPSYKPTKKLKSNSTEDTMVSFSSTVLFEDWSWAEVLCAQQGHYKSKSAAITKHFRWTHVDPHYELFNTPKLVEGIDRDSETQYISKSSSRMKNMVSFVVAVEHKHEIYKENEDTSINYVPFTTKLTDVTPRYANKWSHTLKLRGATAKMLAISGGKCSNKWWAKSLKKINASYADYRRKLGLSGLYHEQPRIQPNSTSTYTLEESGNGKEVVVLQDSSDDDSAMPTHENSLEDNETKEFASSKEKEAIPTSKTAFKNHPLYALGSQLKQLEVVSPDAKKRICGMFKGEVIYKRSDVSTAYTQKKWLYQNRKVRDKELSNPAKIIKARKKPSKKGFQALQSYGTSTKDQVETLKDYAVDETDGNDKLYGIWQTDPWSPDFVGPNDPIPVNEFKNIELALINPGLEHIELRNIAKVAKKLNIPYAPCLLGFEGHGGNRTPTIRGIVVHEQNVELLREAHIEWESQIVEKDYKERERLIYGRWKRLIMGMLEKKRLEKEYAKA